MKKIESLLKTASMKLKFSNLEIRFYKRQVSFLVVKTVKCKRGIRVMDETTKSLQNFYRIEQLVD